MRPDLLQRLPEGQRRLLRPADDDPGAPMLARLTDLRDFGDDWLFERKLDGIRMLASLRDGRVELWSRTGQRLNATYPEVAEALAAQPCPDFVVDGEVVALHRGRTDFALLQQRSGLTAPAAVRASGVAVTYYVFDLLRVGGIDTTRLPQRLRKTLLRDVLDFRAPLRFTPHRNHGGQQLLDQACGRGWEGLIAKRASAPYTHGRSPNWLKLKCEAGQELVVGGFTEPSGSRVGFGALLLGYHQGGRLRYAGKVGTGYDTATLRSLRARLDAIEVDRPPFGEPVRERGAHWVRPELVAQVGFTEWTRDGRLRHPRYLGLREDKAAADVVRETPRGR
ncbi:non-homologous end-joining DNA ligase [Actinacidiphila bryophytorum]|uniref:DNA ligase (ATP) n=1 Tax=Actinacidiphila bryophytorum TaxID=1436133 RepID=A0A9W4H3L9_9ACTN|nr:non-homologous end-joining DNA ligase [Actinacidiphila bryophytorum]MBM9439849.1 non-homologous end-joining DNA ligase [Actinacidiphila bryophytorum]MBN6546993.1 non-homologous end-joining DNA ligase [Actinacidiphila bryophytorum]CAG7648200.1 DNA ligase (ATP) [Actinacidiphila bryophytorum]